LKLTREALSALFRDIPLYFYETTDSTNTRAVEILKNQNPDKFVVVANEQTNGQGRSGKKFYSPKDTGIYFSVVIHSDCDISDIVGITPMAAVAVVNSLEKSTHLNPKIKWVNDIYLNDRKICGILVKAVGNAYIIGIGINVTTKDFPPDISNIAGSVGLETDTNLLVYDIVNSIIDMSEELEERKFMNDYRKKSLVIGREINYYINGVQFDGTAIGIDNSGGLIVEKNGTKKVLTSGEITVRTK